MQKLVMKIYCAGCNEDKKAILTTGKEMYPHRKDLAKLPFWKCPDCECFVGCHHKTRKRTRPLGIMATKELKNARMHIHDLLDPIWQCGEIDRTELYAWISERLGYTYHSAEIRTVEEARKIYKVIFMIKQEIIESRYSPIKAIRNAGINI